MIHAGTILLVNAGRSVEFKPVPKHIRLLEERFGDEIRQIFGIHPRALTANEAGYLVGFRTADACGKLTHASGQFRSKKGVLRESSSIKL